MCSLFDSIRQTVDVSITKDVERIQLLNATVSDDCDAALEWSSSTTKPLDPDLRCRHRWNWVVVCCDRWRERLTAIRWPLMRPARLPLHLRMKCCEWQSVVVLLALTIGLQIDVRRTYTRAPWSETQNIVQLCQYCVLLDPTSAIERIFQCSNIKSLLMTVSSKTEWIPTKKQRKIIRNSEKNMKVKHTVLVLLCAAGFPQQFYSCRNSRRHSSSRHCVERSFYATTKVLLRLVNFISSDYNVRLRLHYFLVLVISDVTTSTSCTSVITHILYSVHEMLLSQTNPLTNNDTGHFSCSVRRSIIGLRLCCLIIFACGPGLNHLHAKSNHDMWATDSFAALVSLAQIARCGRRHGPHAKKLQRLKPML